MQLVSMCLLTCALAHSFTLAGRQHDLHSHIAQQRCSHQEVQHNTSCLVSPDCSQLAVLARTPAAPEMRFLDLLSGVLLRPALTLPALDYQPVHEWRWDARTQVIAGLYGPSGGLHAPRKSDAGTPSGLILVNPASGSARMCELARLLLGSVLSMLAGGRGLGILGWSSRSQLAVYHASPAGSCTISAFTSSGTLVASQEVRTFGVLLSGPLQRAAWAPDGHMLAMSLPKQQLLLWEPSAPRLADTALQMDSPHYAVFGPSLSWGPSCNTLAVWRPDALVLLATDTLQQQVHLMQARIGIVLWGQCGLAVLVCPGNEVSLQVYQPQQTSMMPPCLQVAARASLQHRFMSLSHDGAHLLDVLDVAEADSETASCTVQLVSLTTGASFSIACSFSPIASRWADDRAVLLSGPNGHQQLLLTFE